MRVVYMGTPSFASAILLELDGSAHTIEAVITMPDAPRSRGKALEPSSVKITASALNLDVIEASSLRDQEIEDRIRRMNPDAIVVAAYGAILPPEILEIPRHGCINVHASLLPRWRGAAPIERAILSGDKMTGVSIMQMESGLDTGAYAVQVATTVAGKSSTALTEELASLGAKSLLDVLNRLDDGGDVQWIAQDESEVTYADKIRKEELLLDPTEPAAVNEARVRASSDTAPARARIGGRGVRILAAEASITVAPEGSVTSSEGVLLLGCADTALAVTAVRPDGKNTMEAIDFSRGLKSDSTWERIR